MGLFTRNTMSLEDMTHLVAFLTITTIDERSITGRWIDEDFRTNLVNTWLEEHNHRASHWKLTKISMVSDGLARKMLFEFPTLKHGVHRLIEADQNEVYALIFMQSEQALLFKGITK
ncbi:hypothetical protein [Halomonas saccharevitans]|uniref:Uncharacterized protein n=1 Tax=Halomonas saccharevitans TaxID=416872 RepID=A0A1I7A099_9GAMM|nr:hypothetical protein [Halomonas saccharevitans]SFT68332.1 hypothetical protein SAMN04487956_11462 [Halomonas saccharevitans]